MADSQPDDLITAASKRGYLDENVAREKLGGRQPTPELLIDSGLLKPEQIRELIETPTLAAPERFGETRIADLPEDVARAARDPSNRFGNYIKIGELGRGGFGTVWLAWDPKLERRIALKVLKGSDPDELHRFMREAKTAAGLSHPNIAAVHEVGEAGGNHFIAMQYVDGDTLARLRLSPSEWFA